MIKWRKNIIAVGTAIAGHGPHRTVREVLPHPDFIYAGTLRVGSDAGFGIDKDFIVAPECLAQRRP